MKVKQEYSSAKRKKRGFKKIFAWLLVAILATLIAAGGLWWRDRQQTQLRNQDILRTAQVVQRDLELNIASSGAVAVNRRIDLRFSTPGMVTAVAVKVSDRVVPGQTLAELDTTALEFAVRQSELALERARLSLQALTQPVSADDLALAELAIQDAAQSLTVAGLSQDVSEAQRAYSVRLAQEVRDDVKDAYLNYQDVLKKYGLPEAYGAGMTVAYLEAEGNVGITQVKADYQVQQAQSQWQAAYLSYRQAQAALAQLQEGADPDQVRLTELQIEQAQLNLAEVRAALSDNVLTAPFGGVVASVNLQVGAPASTVAPAITL
ncbi:MAG TPA: biotin/lipoyl-binding protein, partial [Anaerolineae bacterium]|nr:biotin/lipoyl-binding protein [Anaerolineae bacterium]